MEFSDRRKRPIFSFQRVLLPYSLFCVANENYSNTRTAEAYIIQIIFYDVFTKCKVGQFNQSTLSKSVLKVLLYYFGAKLLS